MMSTTTCIAMDPPAYSYSAHSIPSRRSVLDLRALIIANASVLRPKNNDDRSRADHFEVIVAKQPARSTSPRNHSLSNPADQPLQTSSSLLGQTMATSCTHDSHTNQVSTSRTGSLSASSNGHGHAQHYALLVKRSLNARLVEIVFRGEPRDTIEDALEFVLDKLEEITHQHVSQWGRELREGMLSLAVS